ncbi:unnamed protein product [Ascophyllum nodosum]
MGYAPGMGGMVTLSTSVATAGSVVSMDTCAATALLLPVLRAPSSSTDAAPMVAHGMVRHCRSSSQPPAPSVALAGTSGTLAAMDRASAAGCWRGRREDGQRPLTEVDYHGGPLSEVFGSPESEEQQRPLTEAWWTSF